MQVTMSKGRLAPFIILTGGTMKKLLTTLIISTFCFASYSESSVQSTRSQARVSKGSNTDCVIKFHTLSRYKGSRWERVFSYREVAPVLRTLLKNDYRLLKESLERVTYPDALSFVDKKG